MASSFFAITFNFIPGENAEEITIEKAQKIETVISFCYNEKTTLEVEDDGDGMTVRFAIPVPATMPAVRAEKMVVKSAQELSEKIAEFFGVYPHDLEVSQYSL